MLRVTPAVGRSGPIRHGGGDELCRQLSTAELVEPEPGDLAPARQRRDQDLGDVVLPCSIDRIGRKEPMLARNVPRSVHVRPMTAGSADSLRTNDRGAHFPIWEVGLSPAVSLWS
jgi:hypothetical protein